MPVIQTAKRASAMSAAARRAMIVDVALPLVLEFGERVTTRQLADAVGIAEGTIFRAFTDKDDVIRAVVERALDPEPLEAALTAIDAGLPFEKCLDAAIVALQRRVTDVWRVMSAVGPRFQETKPGPQPPSPALVKLFEAHKQRLSVKPADAAKRLRAVTLAVTHPMLNDAPLSSREVAKQFLYGVHARSGSC
ncbi:MAG TPA: TetR/AcrR family transcriptional regulator [Acidimicrobiales bacterium]|nr:TetR/AcrR family transcriptional regulator [Acidimicrobiales bacterium]